MKESWERSTVTSVAPSASSSSKLAVNWSAVRMSSSPSTSNLGAAPSPLRLISKFAGLIICVASELALAGGSEGVDRMGVRRLFTHRLRTRFPQATERERGHIVGMLADLKIRECGIQAIYHTMR